MAYEHQRGPPAKLELMWAQKVPRAAYGFASIVADVDLDEMPAPCARPGLLWASSTQDGSDVTGSTVFDVNNERAAEVVYRDEWLRIYDGAAGVVRAAYSITSGTVFEEPSTRTPPSRPRSKPGCDPKSHRVFVVVSRNALVVSRFSTVICAPVYARRDGLATQVDVGVACGLKRDSTIHCDELVSLPKAVPTDHVGSLTPPTLVTPS